MDKTLIYEASPPGGAPNAKGLISRRVISAHGPEPGRGLAARLEDGGGAARRNGVPVEFWYFLGEMHSRGSSHSNAVSTEEAPETVGTFQEIVRAQATTTARKQPQGRGERWEEGSVLPAFPSEEGGGHDSPGDRLGAGRKQGGASGTGWKVKRWTHTSEVRAGVNGQQLTQ